MTCIVAIGNGGIVQMGADGIRHNDNDQTSRLTEPKIFLRDFGYDKMLIGTSGSHFMNQLIKREWHPRREIFDDRPADEVMWDVRKDIWVFLNDDAHRNVICDQTTNQIQGVILVGFRGQVYTIDSDGALCEYTNNYHAIGAGDEYALGSLYTSAPPVGVAETTDEVTQRLVTALNSTSFHLSSIQGPYTFLKC